MSTTPMSASRPIEMYVYTFVCACVYTHILCTHTYSIHTHTLYTHILHTHTYSVHTHTPYTHILCTHTYSVHTHTLYTQKLSPTHGQFNLHERVEEQHSKITMYIGVYYLPHTHTNYVQLLCTREFIIYHTRTHTGAIQHVRAAATARGVRARRCVCVCVWFSLSLSLSLSLCVQQCLYIHMYVCIYISYIHTYIHTCDTYIHTYAISSWEIGKYKPNFCWEFLWAGGRRTSGTDEEAPKVLVDSCALHSGCHVMIRR
jgi:hypothetical protein